MEKHSRYWPVVVLALSVWLAGGTFALAQVDREFSGFTMENVKSYGKLFCYDPSGHADG